MANILIIGTGPLFAPDVKVFNGQALRTWHLTRPLLNAGHAIDLVVLPSEGHERPDKQDDSPVTWYEHAGLKYRLVNDPAQSAATLQAIHDSKAYDAIVAVNLNAAKFVAELRSHLPFWADLNGHLMGEAQSKCHVYKSDEYLKGFWRNEHQVLRRADRISTVSYKQMLAVLGELGAVGRLNQYTFDHPFTSVIENAAYEGFLDKSRYPKDPVFRGSVFPREAFTVLWSGGFNTWTDTRTLAAALSLAMETDPRIHFVATGGTIPGHDEITYTEFLFQMEHTGFLDRCHMLGWVEARELFPLYKECDLGLNVDSMNYETVFGARNRLTNMMAANLPILTTLGTEISELIREHKLGYVIPIGNVERFANTLVTAARSQTDNKTYGKRAHSYCTQHFTYEATTTSLVQWAKHPQLAPDNQEKIRRHPEAPSPADVALNSLEEQELKLSHYDLDELIQARQDLEIIRSKVGYKLYKKFFS